LKNLLIPLLCTTSVSVVFKVPYKKPTDHHALTIKTDLEIGIRVFASSGLLGSILYLDISISCKAWTAAYAWSAVKAKPSMVLNLSISSSVFFVSPSFSGHLNDWTRDFRLGP
jgi:hypothetical protein